MKLLLADDHTLFRDALVQYIQRAETGSQVTLAKDLPEAINKMKQTPDQDLIILDLRMPGMEGMQGFKQMRELYPEVPIALMSGIAENRDVHAAMNLGAVGYFPKTLSGKALLKAMKQVMSGEKFMPVTQGGNTLMPSYFDDNTKPSSVQAAGGGDFDPRENVKLTPREGEVLSYLLKGSSNKEIANALDLQVVTVKLHVRGVCRKLNAKNRTQAALKAREMGLGA